MWRLCTAKRKYLRLKYVSLRCVRSPSLDIHITFRKSWLTHHQLVKATATGWQLTLVREGESVTATAAASKQDTWLWVRALAAVADSHSRPTIARCQLLVCLPPHLCQRYRTFPSSHINRQRICRWKWTSHRHFWQVFWLAKVYVLAVALNYIPDNHSLHRQSPSTKFSCY